jgi:hypothetical protein
VLESSSVMEGWEQLYSVSCHHCDRNIFFIKVMFMSLYWCYKINLNSISIIKKKKGNSLCSLSLWIVAREMTHVRPAVVGLAGVVARSLSSGPFTPICDFGCISLLLSWLIWSIRRFDLVPPAGLLGISKWMLALSVVLVFHLQIPSSAAPLYSLSLE